MIIEMARRFVLRDATDRPVVVHLDDVDLDRTGQGLSLIEALTALQAPIVIIATSQAPIGLGDAIEIAPLSETALKRLLRDELGLPISVSDHVESLADGNPRFAIQLLEHWIEAGELTYSDSGELVVDDPQVPRTLESLWEARVAQFSLAIDDEALPVLTAAGALGSPIAPQEWLATAAELGVDIESPVFGEVASALVDSGLGAWDGSDRMRLIHQTVAPLLASVSGDQFEKKSHGAAARALSSLYSSNEPGLALRVAGHFRDAGMPQLALVALEPALGSALDLVDSQEIGHVAQAMLDTFDAMGVANESSRRARARCYRSIEWVTSAREDDRERAGMWLDEASVAVASASADVQAEVEAVRAWASISRGGREAAAERLERIVDDESITDRSRGMARMFLTHLYTYLHDSDSVRRHAVVTIKGDFPTAWKLRAREALIHSALSSRNADNAKEHAFPALILAKQLKRLHLEVHIENLSGFIADLDGDFAKAEAHHERAERLASLVQPHAGVRLMAREYRARALVHQGKFAEAFELLWTLADEVESGRAPGIHPWDALFACAVALERDDAAERSRPCVFPRRCNALHVRSIAAALEALKSSGRADAADALRTEAEEVFRAAPGVSEADLQLLDRTL
jgi:hypothetical protein